MKADYVLLQDRLKGEYKDAFQKVQMYSTSNLIGEDIESELMMELLDHMLMAQEEGKPVSTIVDSDYISSDPTTREEAEGKRDRAQCNLYCSVACQRYNYLCTCQPVFHQCAGVGCSYASDRLHRRILYRKCSCKL